MKLIEKAIELKPKYGGTYYNFARIYSKEGKVSLAIDNLRKAIELQKRYKQYAKKSKYFDAIRNEIDFRRLVYDEM